MAVPHHDRRPVDRRRQAAPHPLLHFDLGEILGLLVKIIELLPLDQVGLAEDAGVAAAHVTGADVLAAAEAGAPLGEVEDLGRPQDVDFHPHGAADGEVVDRGEVPDLGDLALERGPFGVAEPEAGAGDVPLDQTEAPGEARLARRDLAGALAGEGGELGLHQADDLLLGRAGEDARHELGAQKAGETGEEMGGHGVSPQAFVLSAAPGCGAGS